MRRALLLLVLALAAIGCGAPREMDDVSYDDRFGSDTTLDLFLPDDSGAHPTVFLIHGGGWFIGNKSNYRNTARRLARSGYAAASVNYRLVPEGQFPHAAQDVLCALAFLQKNAQKYEIDPARVAVMGYSAGGQLSALVGAAWDEDAIAPDCAAGRPSRPAAAIPGDGAYDLRQRSDKQWVQDFMGGTLEQVPERYEQASPIAQIEGNEPPFLLIVGGGDWIGAPELTPLMRDTLEKNGVHAEVLRLAGGGHILQPGVDPGEIQLDTTFDTPEAWLVIVDFLERTIGAP
jgi:acetyl esterase/lipase